jgi:Spy/CpxP family protein refolding chaperone
MNKYLRIAVVIGLGLTFSIGAFAEGWSGHRGHGRGNMEALMELPAETQTLILATMKEVKEENSALRDEIRATREAMKEALTAPTFDEESFKANAEKLETLMTQGFRSFTDAVAQIAPELTQEEREVLAQMGPQGRHGRHDRDTDSE